MNVNGTRDISYFQALKSPLNTCTYSAIKRKAASLAKGCFSQSSEQDIL